MTNEDFAARDKEFRAACRMANTAPTRRMASKFRREIGLAWRALRFAKNNPREDEAELFEALSFAGLRKPDSAPSTWS